MRDVFAGVIGLGIAGFDPLGSLALIAAMALRARRRAIAALLASTLVTTVLLGVLLSSTVGYWAVEAIRGLHDPGHRLWGVLAAASGLALIGWGILRLVRPPGPRRTTVEHVASSSGALAVVGLGVGLSALIDPAFYAFVVLAGDLHGWPHRLLACLVWTSLSQVALIALSAAVFGGAFGSALRFVERARLRWARPASRFASWLLVVLGALLLAEGVAEFGRRWLLP